MREIKKIIRQQFQQSTQSGTDSQEQIVRDIFNTLDQDQKHKLALDAIEALLTKFQKAKAKRNPNQIDMDSLGWLQSCYRPSIDRP